MLSVSPLIGALSLLVSFTTALPRPDSALGNEVAVSAPNGIVLSDTIELASQLASERLATPSSTYYPAAITTPALRNAVGYGASPSSSAYVSTMTYGSGKATWGNTDQYNACVQQCVASFGAPPPAWTAAPTSPPAVASATVASGVTHTVIVAPTQGVLRYVPFMTNASVGDTVRFVWGANNHTVTKSSQLELCNKTSDGLFTSGKHDKGFVFDQVVNDTKPTFYYCGTPGHCQKGMFGIINPPSSFAANTSVGMQASTLTAANPDLATMYKNVNAMTSGNLKAGQWGQNTDMASLPDWSHPFIMENVLYARAFIAQNPDVVGEDGSINLNTDTPLLFPNLAASNNAAAAPSGPSGPSTTSAAPSSQTSSSLYGGSYNSAGRTVVSVGLIVVATLAVSCFLF